MIPVYKYGNIVRALLLSLSAAILFFLLFPVLYAFIWAITGRSGYVSLGNEVTLKWFREVYSDADWLRAIWYSFVTGIISSSVSLVLVMLYYYYSLWYTKVYKLLGYVLVVVPLFFPLIVYALALKMVSREFAIAEPISIILGHIVVIMPIQYLILEGSSEKLKMDWLHSSIIMGATTIEVIRKIVMPNISITLLIAFGCGFLYSFDEIVISNFIIDSENVTVPKKIWLAYTRDIDPSASVVYSSVLIASGIVALVVFFFKKYYYGMNTKKRRKRGSFFNRELYKAVVSGVIIGGIEALIEFIILGHINWVHPVITFVGGCLMYEIGILKLFMVFIWGKDIISKVYQYRKEEHDKYRDLATGLLGYKIDNSIKQLREFFGNEAGVAISYNESEQLSELLFERNKGYYFGTDSNVPSKFSEYYPNFLLSNQHSKASSRILLCSQTDLRADHANNPESFEKFYDWHIQHKVTLLFVQKEESELLKNRLELVHTDIGIWDDDYVVIFQPKPSEKKIHYWFKSYRTLQETELYVKYYMSLLNQAKLIRLTNNGIQFDSFSPNDKNIILNRLKSLWNI